MPDELGKVTFREKASAAYVYYECERTCKSENKCNVAKHATIGKLVDPSGYYNTNRQWFRNLSAAVPTGIGAHFETMASLH